VTQREPILKMVLSVLVAHGFGDGTGTGVGGGPIHLPVVVSGVVPLGQTW